MSETASSLTKPTNLDIERVDDRLIMRQTWYSRSIALLSLCCVPPFLFVIIAYLPIFQGAEYNWMSIAVPLPFLFCGLLIGYGSLAGFFNSTTISFDEEKLDISHGPLWWWSRSVRLDAGRVRRFLVTQPESKKKRPKFELSAQVSEQEVVRLLRGLPDLETAHYMKEKLQDHLARRSSLEKRA